MKLKFRVVDPKTNKVHRLNISGDTLKACEKLLAARLVMMGISRPREDQIHFKTMKK